MVKHTPGPWRVAVEGERMAFAQCHITGANGRPVASTIYPLACPDWREEDTVNAHLIAAAPELLAALEGLVANARAKAFGLADEWGVVLKNAEAAITKATNPQAR